MTLKRKTPLKPGKMSLHRAALKAGTKRLRSRGPKMTPIRKSAKGEECTIRLPMVCNFDTSTTVLCHGTEDKGMGLKSSDLDAAYGCNKCHDVVDRRVPLPAWLTREQVDEAFRAAIKKTHAILIRKKLIKVEP